MTVLFTVTQNVITQSLAGLELYHDVRGFRFPAQLRAFSRVPGRRPRRFVVRPGVRHGPRQQPVLARRQIAAAPWAIALDRRFGEAQRFVAFEPGPAKPIGLDVVMPASRALRSCVTSNFYARNRLVGIRLDHAPRNEVALHRRRDFYVNVRSFLSAFDLNDLGLRLFDGVRVESAALPRESGDQITARLKAEDSIYTAVIRIAPRPFEIRALRPAFGVKLKDHDRPVDHRAVLLISDLACDDCAARE